MSRRRLTSAQLLDRTLSEAEWQSKVVALAKTNGWEHFHAYDARRSEPGFPDLTIWHPRRGGVLFAELKTETGRVSPAQRAVLGSLHSAGAEVYLWRPSDLPAVVERLTRRPRRG